MEVELIGNNQIGKIRGSASQRYTDGIICAKVARYAERVHHPDRLKTPLMQVGQKGSNNFKKISWSEAMGRIAERFFQDSELHGKESVWPYYYGGTMGLIQRDGINRLRHTMGYSGMAKTICASIASAGWKAGVGASRGSSPYEMADADLILVWGTNIVSTQINAMHHISKARKKRGAKLIVIDPYENPTTKVADQHICIRPGTDGALAVAMMHVLFREKLVDTQYMEKYTDCPKELEIHLRSKTPGWASEITGLDVSLIEQLAIEYGSVKRAFIRVGFGLTRQRNGAAAIHSISCLPSVTGKWPLKGGGALFSNSDIYKIDKTLIEGLDSLDNSIRVLDMSQIGRILTGCKESLLGGSPIKSMITQNTNPMVVAPEHRLVKKGFEREDLFLCVHEQFMTETAKMADIVLPATTFLEHDDIYLGGGHSYVQLGLKVIEPYAECKSNHDVINILGKLLGAEHPGFKLDAIRLIDLTLKESGYPGLEHMRKIHWYDCLPSSDETNFISGFHNSDKKFHFAPNWKNLGPLYRKMPLLPDHFDAIDHLTSDFPFRLITSPARSFLNSTFTETSTSRKREKKPVLLIHPDSAKTNGIKSDDIILIGSKSGEVKIHAEIFEGTQPETLVVESLWPNSAFIGGVGINALTSADKVAPNGGAAFHDTAVWLKKIN